MITTAVTAARGDAEAALVMLPTATIATEMISPRIVVAGLPLWRRIVLAAHRAGFSRIFVSHPDLMQMDSGDGAPVQVLSPRLPLPDGIPRRVVFLASNVVPETDWLRRLRIMPVEPDHAYFHGDSVAVVDVDNPRQMIAMAADGRTMAEVVIALRATGKTVDEDLGDDGRVLLTSARDLRIAEGWLLRRLIKPTEGVMSRLVERRMSLALTRRLCATRITPNAMTLISVGIGLLGAPFFLSSTPAWQLIGALLFLAHSILDGCDGELARLLFRESRLGALLDFVGDNVVHAAVFSCMAVGWSLEARAAWPLLLGAVAVGSTAACAVIVYGRGVHASVDGDRLSPLARFADTLAYRDFIYVIVILAAVGRAWWFVLLTALGGPAFLLLLAWLRRRAG